MYCYISTPMRVCEMTIILNRTVSIYIIVVETSFYFRRITPTLLPRTTLFQSPKISSVSISKLSLRTRATTTSKYYLFVHQLTGPKSYFKVFPNSPSRALPRLSPPSSTHISAPMNLSQRSNLLNRNSGQGPGPGWFFGWMHENTHASSQVAPAGMTC